MSYLAQLANKAQFDPYYLYERDIRTFLHNLPLTFSPLQGENMARFLEQNGYFTFSFVRHPFDRLVSCYKDKVENFQPGGPGEDIYRKTNGNTTFNNFLQMIIENHKDSIRPDWHWMPFYEKCYYCYINYTFIGRLESFDESVKYILLEANLTNIIPLEQATMHLLATDQGSQSHKLKKFDGKASARTLQYFAPISKLMIMKLYEIYKKDFLLFGYNIHGLLD